MLKGLPALGSPGLVGLDRGYEWRHEASQELWKLCSDILRSILVDGACELQRTPSVSAHGAQCRVVVPSWAVQLCPAS